MISPVMAQQIQDNSGAPAAAFEVANGSRTFTVTVLGGPVSSGSLTLTLPTGYVYDAGSLAGSGVTVSESAVAGNVATVNLTGIPATGTNATFTFTAHATCSAIGVAGNQVSYVFTPSGGSAQPARLSNAFNLLNAKLNITNLANAPNTAGAIGDTYTRTFRINNNGFGNIDTLYVTDVSGNGVAHLGQSVSTSSNGAAVTVDLLSSTPSGSNTTYLYRFIVSGTAQDNHLGQNEYFTFTQNLQITNCSDLNTALNAWYGNSPNAQPCVPQNDTQTTALAVDNSKTPLLTVAYVSTDPMTCAPADGWLTASVTNNGTAPATAVNLRFGLNIYNQNLNLNDYGGDVAPAWIDETNGVQYSTDGGATWSASPYSTSYYIVNASNTPAIGKPLDVIVTPPAIAPGQTMLIRFKRHIECRNFCWNNELNFRGASLLSGTYKNGCNAGNYSLTSQQMLPEAAIRGIHIPEMPVDAVGGQPYWVEYKTGEWLGVNLNTQYLTGAGAYTEMIVKLPDCLVPDLSTLALVDGVTGGSPVTPDLVFTDTEGIHIRFNVSGDFYYLNKRLRLKTMVNCAIACADPTISSKIIFKQSASCACTDVLWCATWTPVLHCGPCPAPLGIDNNESSATRVNIGGADDDNNGTADAPGANYPSKVRTSYFTIGDEMQVTATGEVFGTGSFDFAYLSMKAPAQPVLTLVPGSGKATIFDASSGTTYNLASLPVTGSYPDFTVDISVAALTAAGMPAGFTYGSGDKISVSVNYSYPFAGNFSADSNFGQTNYGTDGAVNFRNVLYGGLAANPMGADRMACDTPYVATMYYQSMQWGFQNVARDLQYTGCAIDDLNANANSGLYFFMQFNNQGNSRTYNWTFPYEINTKLQPKEYVFTLPAGMEAIGVRVLLSGISGPGTTVVLNTPDNVVGQQYHYNLESAVNALKGVPYTEEGFTLVITPLLRASCQGAASGNISSYVSYTLAGDPTLRTMSYDWPYTVTSQGNLTAVPASPVQTVTGNTVSWEVQVTNTGNAADMPNVWLGKNTAGGGTVTITSVQELPGSGAASGTPVSATGDVYQLGTIPASTSKYYLVTATFTNCAQDHLQLAYGWNCSGYPASVATAVCLTNTDLTVIPTDANLQVSLVSQPTPGLHDLCEELEYVAEVKNPAQGTAYGLTFVVDKPAGVAYIANSFQLSPTIQPTPATLTNVNNDALVAETATSFSFTIPASVVANLPYNQGYTIRYKVRTVACDFVSGTKMNLQALGKNGCGSDIYGTRQQTQAVHITGENPNPNSYTITSSAPTLEGCSPAPLTYTFSAVNNGPVATYAGESIRIAIPKPFTLGAVTGISNFPSGAAPALTSDATSNIYTWTMPVGIAAGQTIAFSAPLAVGATDLAALGCTALPVQELIAYTFTSFCVPSGPSCSGTLQAEGQNDATRLVVSKPAYAIAAFTGTANATGTGVDGSLTLTNSGSSFVSQNAVLSLFKDIDGNGAYSAGDILLGTQSLPLANTASQTFPYSISSSYKGNICPLVALVSLDCACSDTLAYAYTCNIPLPVSLAAFTVRPEGPSAARLNWVTASELNNAFFEIQHSLNARDFEPAGQVPGHGTTRQKQSYTFLHQGLDASHIHYYRLRQVDADGKFQFSKTLSVALDGYGGIGLTVTPNPATGRQIRALVKLDDDMLALQAELHLLSPSGQRITTRQIRLVRGVNEVILPTDNLPAGTYIVALSHESLAAPISIRVVIR